MSVLGTWLRTGWIERVELSAGPDGRLVLAGSSSKLARTFGVILSVEAKHPKVIGGFTQEGVLALAPTLTLRGLTLPLESDPTGIHHVFLRTDELFTTDHHGKSKQWKKKGPTPPHVPSIGECL